MRNQESDIFHLILGDALFSDHSPILTEAKGSHIFMAEDLGLCTHYRYHKHKIIFFLASMRAHALALSENHFVTYFPLERSVDQLDTRSFEEKLSSYIQNKPHLKRMRCYEVEDQFFEKRLKSWGQKNTILIEWIVSAKFLFPRQDFKNYLKENPKPFLKTYYQRQRIALNILVDDQSKPLGGKWSFDEENRKKLPKNSSEPIALSFSPDNTLKEVKVLVQKYFSDHPGSVNTFNWAWKRKQALAVLAQFLDEKFELFGPYEDAFEAEHSFLYHSTLSPYLNMGLLSPQEVLDAALHKYRLKNIHLPSVEGFVRQLMGWREFMRGMYCNFDFNQNHFGFKRKMSSEWYEGTTGIPPLDDAIKKLKNNAYNHHIERLMVIGNIMLLCELEPKGVYSWFMEMYIDSADWVMAPNVFGMSQYAAGGLFATKPYISGSNYLRKMSHYPKGDWCDIMDGLYWRFIDEQKETFAKNHRMSMMVASLRKMNPERKIRLWTAAEKFIEKVTYLP